MLRLGPHPNVAIFATVASPSAVPFAAVSVCALQIAELCWPTQIGMNFQLVASYSDVTFASVHPEPASHAPPMYTPLHFTPWSVFSVFASATENADARSTPRMTTIAGGVGASGGAASGG